MPRRIMVVDGSSLLFKAYHGYEPRKSPDGRDVTIIFGTFQMITGFMKILSPHHVVVVFDAPGGSYERKAIYPDYKAHRPERPEEMMKQEPLLRKFLRAGGTPVLSVIGVEADDVMATIAKEGSENGSHVGIVSSDKDLVQLVRPLVTVFRPERGESGKRELARISRKNAFERFGVHPEQMVDYLSLLGDTADNVPGIDKVGHVTATEWLKKYGSIDELILHANELPGIQGKNFRSSLDMLPTIRSLIKLRDDVDVPDWQTSNVPDEDLLREMRAEMGFPSWFGSLRDWCLNDDIA